MAIPPVIAEKNASASSAASSLLLRGRRGTRPRPLLSCLECHRKKLKCNRSWPCNQCAKAYPPKEARECVFEGGKGSALDGEEEEEVREGEVRSVLEAGGNPAPESPSIGDVRSCSGDGSGETRARSGSEKLRKRKRSRFDGNRDVNGDGRGEEFILPGEVGSADTNAGERLGVLKDLQARVWELERLVKQGQLTRPERAFDCQSPARPRAEGNVAVDVETVHGKGHRMTLFGPFEETKDILWGMPTDPVLKPYIQRFRRLQQSRVPRRTSVPGQSQNENGDSIISKMLAALPSQEYCYDIVNAYEATSEKTLRILHMPTFLKMHDQFWRRQQKDTAPFGFIPQLISVLAASCNAGRLQGASGSHAGIPLSSSYLCELVQMWLSDLKRRETYSLTVLQVQTVLVLAQHNIFIPTEKTWIATGSLVRCALMMRLHRDPLHSPEISIFQGELRRRLWASIVEMDLQSSLVWGMRAMVRHADYDTEPPANLDDRDLFEHMAELPKSKPVEIWTESLLQVLLARSLPHRLRIADFINGLKFATDDNEKHRHGRDIEQLLDGIPYVARPEASDHPEPDISNQARGNLLGRVLLDICIRRLLVYLYRSFATRVADADTCYRARRICRDSALTVLSHQDAFQPNTSDTESADGDGCWVLFHNACRHDVLLAVVGICWEIRMMNSSRPVDVHPSHDTDASERPRVLGDSKQSHGQWTKVRLIRIAEDALAKLMHKVDMPGGFMKDVLGLAIILQSVKTTGSQQRREEMMRSGAISVFELLIGRLYPDEPKAPPEAAKTSNQWLPGRVAGTPEEVSEKVVRNYQSEMEMVEDFDQNFFPTDDLGVDYYDFTVPTDWQLY